MPPRFLPGLSRIARGVAKRFTPSLFSRTHPMKILLARHGETPWNAEGRYQGQIDIPLSPVGEGQARALGDRLADVAVTRAVASPLSRALSMLARTEITSSGSNAAPRISSIFVAVGSAPNQARTGFCCRSVTGGPDASCRACGENQPSLPRRSSISGGMSSATAR